MSILQKIPKMNYNVNYCLGVIIMYQCRLINCNKCTALVRDFDNGGGGVCGYVGVESVREISTPSPPFFCEPKITLKNDVLIIIF